MGDNQNLEKLGVEILPSYLQEFPLPDEGGDKGFTTSSGNRFRVRLTQTDKRVEISPNSLITDRILETSYTITLTLSQLDDNNEVLKVNDKYVIYEPHEILITDEQLSNPEFDIDTVLFQAIEEQIKKAESIAEKRTQVAHSLVNKWGVRF